MTNPVSQFDLVNSNVELAKSYGILQLDLEGIGGNGRTLIIDGKDRMNFGSCSYLGLETDHRLVESAQKVIDEYGVYFSSSRSYLSIGYFVEAENLLAEIFGKPVVIALSTTLAHMALIPIVVGRNDHLILDQQVHSSISFSVKQAPVGPERIEKLRHNRMDYLENRLKKLCGTNDKVWYFADGVYSMFGDFAPLKDLAFLLEKYENFHLYLDDAHGMSWAGERGSGYVLSHLGHHPRITLTTSLAKAFGTSGGVIVCQDEAQKRMIRNCGSTLVFSGALQPPSLGALVGSAKVHLSDDMPAIQKELQDRITYFREKVLSLGLPLITKGESPVFYIGLGSQEISCKLCEALIEEGFYTCVSGFPSVPYINTGLRILLNRHQQYADYDALLEALNYHLQRLFIEYGQTMEKVFKAFKVPV